jgi:hypothetical protein
MFKGNFGVTCMEIPDMNRSGATIRKHGAVVQGHNCTVYGDGCVINGHNCTVHGNGCIINGHNCTVYGKNTIVNGHNCTLDHQPAINNGLNTTVRSKTGSVTVKDKVTNKAVSNMLSVKKPKYDITLSNVNGMTFNNSRFGTQFGANSVQHIHTTPGGAVFSFSDTNSNVFTNFSGDGGLNIIGEGVSIMRTGNEQRIRMPSGEHIVLNDKILHFGPNATEDIVFVGERQVAGPSAVVEDTAKEKKEEPELTIPALKPGEKAERPEDECIICMENKIKTVYVPCGHSYACIACVHESKKANKLECQLCKKVPTMVTELFSK